MRPLALLGFSLLLLCVLSPLLSTTPSAVAIPPGQYNKAYRGDPANDVQVFNSTYKTPVLREGRILFSSWTGEVDLREVSSRAVGGNISISAVVHGTIPVPTWSNTTFVFDLYTDAQDNVHHKVNWTGGMGGNSWLYSNGTSFTPVDITGNASIDITYFTDDTLTIEFPLSLIPSITAWDIDVSSEEVGPTYTYRDFIYQVPGHPGTSPATISGHAYDADGTTPLGGVNVSTDVGGYYTQTDAAGVYVLFLGPGTYNITARKDGYHPMTLRRTIGSTEVLNDVNFQLTPLGPLERLGLMAYALIAAVVLSGAFVLLFLILRRRRKAAAVPSWQPPRKGPGIP